MAATTASQVFDQLRATDGVSAALIGFVAGRLGKPLSELTTDVNAAFSGADATAYSTAVSAYDPTAWTTVATPNGPAKRILTSTASDWEKGLLPRGPSGVSSGTGSDATHPHIP